MAITSGRLVVVDTPALIISEPLEKGGYTIIVQNLSNAKSVYLNGENVTAQTGFELKKGAIVTVPVSPDEALYGVTDEGFSAEVCYLVTKR